MSQCLLCGRPLNGSLSLAFLMDFQSYRQEVICKKCHKRFKRINKNHCCRDCCRVGDFKDHLCQDCQRWRRLTGKRFRNYSLYRYNSIMSEYMHRYKFMGDYRLRHVFKAQFSQFVMSKKRVIIPIPIHRGTYQQRGFNQVRGFLEEVPTKDLLITKDDHKAIPQSHKSRLDRLKLKQPFQLSPHYHNELMNQDVAIVDDVYTTGTTIRHAARILKGTGVKSVIGITLAR